MDRVVVEGWAPVKVMRDLLAAAGNLKLHSNVVLLANSSAGLTVHHYVWTHVSMRPWGHSVPVQCPSCACLLIWSSPRKDGSSYVLECASRVPPCDSAPHRFVAPMPESFTWLDDNTSSQGRWLELK